MDVRYVLRKLANLSEKLTKWTRWYRMDTNVQSGQEIAMKLRPGFLDQLAADINAKSDYDLASFLGLTEKQLENLRYGAEITPQTAAVLEARRAAHLKAAEILNPTAA